MADRPLKWSVPDRKHDGTDWTDAERETALQVAFGCDAVGMAGIFNAAAVSEYITRAGLLDLVGHWPTNRKLTYLDVFLCIGLRTNARKVARPSFLAQIARSLNWQAVNQLDEMKGNPELALHQATTLTLGRLEMSRTMTRRYHPNDKEKR